VSSPPPRAARPPNLPAALLHHAARDAEEPWLFRPEGWDWRWHSWGEIARKTAAWAESLASRPAGSRVPFAWSPVPDAVAYDLGVQAAGLVSEPLSGGPPPGPSPLAPLPPHSPRPGEGNGVEAFEGSAGGVVVIDSGAPLELTAAGLISLAETVEAVIDPRPNREIVVLSGPLENPDERALLSWATVAGAAVVLEPTPCTRVATAAWVRPTVFHGTPAEIAALRGWVAKERRSLFQRAFRLPFRRLHTLLVVGPDDLPEEEAAFWRERGVRICRRAA
jgi:hypothetical protein